jgi:predicted regulator of Ras-like GTPase activity (Roadblock/LC7/MglB family)
VSKIHDTVAELRRIAGVKGAAVITNDGLVAAESLDARYRSDVIAGLTSYLLMSTNRSLREGGLGDCSQFVMHATHGKAVLIGLEESFLVVLFDQFADLQTARKELQEAAQRIRRTSRIS